MERRSTRRREEDKTCHQSSACPTRLAEMKDIRNRLDNGGEKMTRLYKEIKKNRMYDKIILLVGLTSLIITFLKG